MNAGSFRDHYTYHNKTSEVCGKPQRSRPYRVSTAPTLTVDAPRMLSTACATVA